jgi:long-chain acyl-CoA synthetase
MKKNLIDKFAHTASLYPDKIAIEYKEKGEWVNISYSKLDDNIKSLAVFLLNTGVKRSSNIAIILRNGPSWPVSFFAIISAGAVPIPINPDSPKNDIENILKDSGAILIFTDNSTCKAAEDIKSRNSFIGNIINVDSEEFTNATNAKEKEQHLPETSENDLACILYTSGTTGKPKGVMLSHKNLFSNCCSLNKLQIIRASDSVVSILPLHHAYPLNITMLLPLLYGARIIYPASIKSDDISEAMLKTNPSVFVAVPQFFHTLYKKISEKLKRVPFPFSILLQLIIETAYSARRITGVNISRVIFSGVHKKFGKSMRLFASGGAKLNEKAALDLIKLGFTISEGYGLSETSPVLTFNPPAKPKIGSVGISIPDVEIKIANPDRQGRGEVIARGPNIMEGYYKRADITSEVIKNGWFYTGDLGFVDKDGYLFLTGRSKDIIVLSSGLNIYPEDVEAAYIKGVPIKEICVFEAEAEKGAEANLILWAVVRPDFDFFKKYGEVNLRDVIKERIDNVSRTLPAYNRIMGFSVTLDELPRTALGKLKRFEVKKIYAPKAAQANEVILKEKEISEEDRLAIESENAKKIIAKIKEHFNIKQNISPIDTLEIDLGIDSLGRVELASAMEELFHVKIEDEIIGRVFTIKDLVLELEAFLKDAGNVTYDRSGKPLDGKNYWHEILKTLPEKANMDKLDLKPGPFAWIAGFLFLLPFYVFFKVFYNLKVEGAENVSNIKRHILYVNHTSYFDGLLLGVSLPWFPKLDMFFIGFAPYFNVIIIRNLVKIGRIIPLDFASHLTEALRSCYYVLSNEKNLCIFPEGMRTLDGNIGKFKKGFGIIAKESNAKLVPVILEGAYEAWPRTSKFPKRHPITVRFGKALDVKDLEMRGLESGINDSYAAICHGAREALVKLKN